MDYPRITHKVFFEPCCITPEAHYAVQRVLEAHLVGGAGAASLGLSPRNHFNAANLELSPPRDANSRVYTRGKLAYIPVSGIISKGISRLEAMCGGYDLNQLHADLEVAKSNAAVKNILIDFNSPGGSTTGVPEGAEAIRLAGETKKVYGFTDTMSASASYWLMSQCTNIYATGSAVLGSIGVYLALLDSSEEMKARGVALKLFKAGAHKGMGLPGNVLSEEDEKLLQSNVDKWYGLFTKAVTSTRSKVKTETMQGQTFLGMDCRQNGLIDATVGSLGHLIERLS